MLKIPKGLKKKKKGKKSKKKGDEELFTEEELEQYRREHQAQAQPESHQQPEEAQSEQPKPNNDEWSKFNALTTGVDSILKKTQGDLDRIKSTSFFQRIPAGPKSVDQSGKQVPLKRDAQKEGQGWVDFEKEKEKQKAQEEEQKLTVTTEVEPVSEAAFSESESEEDDFDDIFDTSYVEAVEKGEVKLAYIPDSPDEVEEEGPDPFDTAYAEKVIKGPEVSKKGKKLVNIGAAVEVLTGRLDNVITSSSSIKRPKRRVPRDLLYDTVDPDDILDAPTEETVASKSLLDDDAEILDSAPIDLSVSLHTQFIKKEQKEEGEEVDKQKEVLSEFDVIVDDEDDEFAQLATESLSKPVIESQVVPQLPVEPIIEEDSWSAFEDLKKKPQRPPPPGSTPVAANLSGESPEFDEGPDPFDTTFAENILPGKAELKQIEEEILNDNSNVLKNSDSDFDFNPRESEIAYINNRRKSSVHIHVTDPTGVRESISGYDNNEDSAEIDLKPIRRDLLGGSTTDLSQLADAPIAPSALDNENFEYSDPFDTSIVDSITAPGKTELKFIEKELLGEGEIKKSLSDPDFDPRAEEKAEACKNAPRKPSRPENLFVNKSVLFNLPTENTLESEKNHKKPVTPYYNREASVTEEDIDTQDDPFDTSPVLIQETNKKPVTSILKKSTNETEIKRSLSNQDLNAEEESINEKTFSQLRRHSDFPIKFTAATDFDSFKNKTDFLSISEEESVDTKVLTPYQESSNSFDLDVDPFDTSIVNDVLLPGKTELKFLESELLSQQSTTNHLLDPDFDPRAGENSNNQPQDLLAPSDDVFQIKALTPEIPETATGFLIGTEEDDIDPFDTSIADNIKPGKTELKLLESEFIN